MSLAAASESLYIETVPGLDALPDVLETVVRHATVFASDECFDERFAPVMIFLVTTDEIADIVTGIALVSGLDLLFNPFLHQVRQ